MVKKNHTDQKYIEALLFNDRKMINEIYKRFSGKIRNYVLANSGSAADAADIFQESLIDLYQQAKYKNLQLTCPFEPFFLLVCKRKWLNHLKKNSILTVTNQDEGLLSNIGDDVFKFAKKVERDKYEMETYLNALEELSEKCRELIRETISGKHQEEVAKRMNISYAYLRKKKSNCIASLIKIVKAKKHTDEIHI